MTKIFFDTEFTGLHQETTLISIGLISECGKTFYAEFDDYKRIQCDKWIRENVLSNLRLHKSHNQLNDFNISKNKHEVIGHTGFIKNHLSDWLLQFDKVEMWSDCLAYDWVLFNNIFGTAFDIPKNVYYVPFDICTLFKLKGIDPDISREEYAGAAKFKKHNALFDAEIIRKCYAKLIK